VTTVIAPQVAMEFSDLPVRVIRRRYRDGDLAGAWLAHAATDDPAVNAAVAAEAERARIWCARADDASLSAARIPAVTRHGDVTVAVTAGADPRRSQRLRSAIASALAEGRLPVRPQRRPRKRYGRPRGTGMVTLVGGGPGDPGLITVQGRRALAEADVVVADRLGPRELLDELDPDVEVIEAGKSAGAHRLTQDQINALIVDRALAGSRVVRLKGGDPFVFGRGGEEAEYLAEHGIPCEVVPGVTSALAACAAAGMPLTHRADGQAVALVSGHFDPDTPGCRLDWAALARMSNLIFYMGLRHLDRIAARLVAAGLSPDTPAAVIESATLPNQRVIDAPLSDLPRLAREAAVQAPAVIVVGAAVLRRPVLTDVLEAAVSQGAVP
jgi:uroporphyrin-III C-methyltransferase / precorrin-2 dehydrogenase / sirohydrochlorin ferrochelatase